MNYNSNFQYAWRFTDEKYNKVSVAELEKIKELTEEESLEFWNENIICKILYYPISDIIKNNQKIIDDCGWGNTKLEDETRRILMDLFDPIQEILVFWGPKHAIKLKSDIFIKYWSDFCYRSDSGNVIYSQLGSIFIYHEDILLKA